MSLEGYIKIESTNTWVYGDLNLHWVGAQLTSVVKTWIAGEYNLQKQIRNNPWFIDVNDAHQNYLDKSLALIPAPRIKIPDEQYALVQNDCKIPLVSLMTLWANSGLNINISSLTNAEREAMEQAQGGIVRNEEIEIELDFIPKNPDKAIFFEGMWVPYELVLYNTDDGGMLLPREIANTNINEIGSWVNSENLIFRTVENDENHTVLGVEELDYRNPSPDLPVGYSQAVKQVGICKIAEDILDSNSSVIGKKAKIKTKLIGNTSILGVYEKGGVGNLEVSIGDHVAEYGIVEQQNAAGTKIVYKYEITGTSADNPLNRTVNGQSAFSHPDFETWLKSGRSVDLIFDNQGNPVDVFPVSQLAINQGMSPNRTLAADLNYFLTGGRVVNLNSLNPYFRSVFGSNDSCKFILNYWIDIVAAQAIEPSSAPVYNVTYDFSTPASVWGMFKINDVYVPDMPEFADWLDTNYPGGIPMPTQYATQYYFYQLGGPYLKALNQPKENFYNSLRSGNSMHGGSGGE